MPGCKHVGLQPARHHSNKGIGGAARQRCLCPLLQLLQGPLARQRHAAHHLWLLKGARGQDERLDEHAAPIVGAVAPGGNGLRGPGGWGKGACRDWVGLMELQAGAQRSAGLRVLVGVPSCDKGTAVPSGRCFGRTPALPLLDRQHGRRCPSPSVRLAFS